MPEDKSLSSPTRAKRRCRYAYCHDYFSSIDSEEKSYWLGFLFADGSVNLRCNRLTIGLSRSDRGHLEKFRDALKGDFRILDYWSGSYPASQVYLDSDRIVTDLVSLGFPEREDIPDGIPVHLLSHFVRGFFDGDGCVGVASGHTPSSRRTGYREYQISITNCSRPLLSSIQSIICLGANIRWRRIYGIRYKNAWTIAYCGNLQVRRIALWLYAGATVFLDRKYHKLLPLLEV